MRQPLLLAGATGRPYRRISPLTFLTIVLAASFVLWKCWPLIAAAVRPPVPAMSQGMAADDLQLRFEDIRAHLMTAMEKSQRSQEMVRRVAPVIRGKGYPLECKWLESSDAYDDATQQAIEQALREAELGLRIVNKQVKKETKP